MQHHAAHVAKDAWHDLVNQKVGERKFRATVFSQDGEMELIANSVDNKDICLKTSSNIELHENFVARVTPGNGRIAIESDLTGLKGGV